MEGGSSSRARGLGSWHIPPGGSASCARRGGLRGEVAGELAATTRSELDGANGAELILHAYAAWGEGCVCHLLGDFAFAIWDRRQRRLFCARDHFGIKPFFYAHRSGSFVF